MTKNDIANETIQFAATEKANRHIEDDSIRLSEVFDRHKNNGHLPRQPAVHCMRDFMVSGRELKGENSLIDSRSVEALACSC